MSAAVELLYRRYFNAGILAIRLPGAPAGGKFREEVLKPGSLLDGLLHDVLFMKDKAIALTTAQIIAAILMMDKSRKATRAQIFERISNLPYIKHGGRLKKGSDHDYLSLNICMDVQDYLLKEGSLYEVKFPLEVYDQLGPEPKTKGRREDSTIRSAWGVDVGAEMVEEEKDPEGEVRYNWDYGTDKNWGRSWHGLADREMNRRHRVGTGRSDPDYFVYTLPPGMENDIFAPFYDAHRTNLNANLDIGSSGTAHDHFSALPAELKIRIARLVLVFPTKLAIAATKHEDAWSMGMSPYEIMKLSTYKFSSVVKVPKSMIDTDIRIAEHSTSHYWEMEPPSTMLALLSVSKGMHEIGKPIFYGENYFEVRDGQTRYHNFVVGNLRYDDQLAYRFLELMSWSEARDGTPRYGSRPLELIRKINVDMELDTTCDPHFGGQPPWHFERIVNALVTIPRLGKLVIDVRMAFLETLDLPRKKRVNPYIHPELWPGWRKLPWADSTSGLKVFVPENRKVEKWLQNLIDMPDNTPAKIGDVTPEDWSTAECPSALIVQGLEKAEKRWMEARKDDKAVQGQDMGTERDTEDTKDSKAVTGVA
jgi:hypothetical protein